MMWRLFTAGLVLAMAVAENVEYVLPEFIHRTRASEVRFFANTVTVLPRPPRFFPVNQLHAILL